MKTYTPKEFAEKIGVAVRTLQRWDRDGQLVAGRTPGNRRVYTDAHLARVESLAKAQTKEESGSDE